MNIFISFLLYFPPPKSSKSPSTSPSVAVVVFCLGSCSGALDNGSAPLTADVAFAANGTAGAGCAAAAFVADGAVAANGFGNAAADGVGDSVGDADGDEAGDEDEEKISLSPDL